MIRTIPKSLNGWKEESLLALENPGSSQRSCKKHPFSWPWQIDTGYPIAKFFTCFKAYFYEASHHLFLCYLYHHWCWWTLILNFRFTKDSQHHSRLYEDSSWHPQSAEKKILPFSIFSRNLIWVKYCWLSTWPYQTDNCSAILSLLNLCLLHTFTHCSQSRENTTCIFFSGTKSSMPSSFIFFKNSFSSNL